MPRKDAEVAARRGNGDLVHRSAEQRFLGSDNFKLYFFRQGHNSHSCQRWIRWPNAEAGDNEAETYECLAIVPYALDTHGEGDGWGETQSFAAVRARELGKKARAYGVPSGAALVIGSDGSFQARGDAVTVFAALPNRKAKIEKQLEVDE